MSDESLMALARTLPADIVEFSKIHGMSTDQVRTLYPVFRPLLVQLRAKRPPQTDASSPYFDTPSAAGRRKSGGPVGRTTNGKSSSARASRSASNRLARFSASATKQAAASSSAVRMMPT